MSVGTDSNTRARQVYVRLLEEGTEVFRPTEALPLGNDLYRVLATTDYDSEDEVWEFPPGSIIRVVKRRFKDGVFVVAVKQ